MLIVEKDAVHGTDQHNVFGSAPSPSGPVPYSGVGDYKYAGTMTDELSDFVRIAGVPVALTTSRSSLNRGEDVPPTGEHSGPRGSGFTLPFKLPPRPPAPEPIPLTLRITDPIGVGRPNVGAGSDFVSVAGRPVLLDGDAIDTCDGTGRPKNSTVTSSRQSFVKASG
ncbi:MAG: hypothetical protein ACRDTH_01680 [Pseudonocardiaceae bacterium]